MFEDEKESKWSHLPPEVRREFMLRQSAREVNDEEHLRFRKKIAITGLVVGAVSGLVIGPLTTSFNLVFIVFIFTQAGMGWLIAGGCWGHLSSVAGFAAPPILVSVMSIGIGLIQITSLLTFIFMCSGWAVFTFIGGAIGYWARTREKSTGMTF